VRLVHEPTGDGRPGEDRPERSDVRVLASEVDVADSVPAKLRGLTFRRSIPEGYALVFEFDRVARRSVHMLFVPFPLDVVWTADGEVTATKTLRPWIGLGMARGDRFVELPAGAAGHVRPGDEVRLTGDRSRPDGR